MTFEEINAMISEIGFESAYHHFAEGENPEPPFIVYYSPESNTFSADNVVYFSTKTLYIGLYTTKKDLVSEYIVETVLNNHEIFFSKYETWTENRKYYEITYKMEV